MLGLGEGGDAAATRWFDGKAVAVSPPSSLSPAAVQASTVQQQVEAGVTSAGRGTTFLLGRTGMRPVLAGLGPGGLEGSSSGWRGFLVTRLVLPSPQEADSCTKTGHTNTKTS